MKRMRSEAEQAPSYADAPPAVSSPEHQHDRKKKKSKGRKKSKAERLARLPVCTLAAPSLAVLRALLAAPGSSTSREWDEAQSLALRLGTLEARALVVHALLVDKQAPRAAAHYAKRLDLRGDDLLNGVFPPEGQSCGALAIAQFLVELDEHTLSTRERLQRFLWPWLLQLQQQHTAQKEKTTAIKAAVHLLLHPVVSEQTSAKALEKHERCLVLQRALVAQCLRCGELPHLVPTHSRAFQSCMISDSSWLAGEDKVQDASHPLEQDQQRGRDVAERVQRILQLLWPDARVLVFGSSITGLLPHEGGAGDNGEPADVDLCVLLPSAVKFRQDTAQLVTEVKEHLALYLLPNSDAAGLTAVTRARIPIVHFQDPLTRLPCDLCVNNLPALWNTRLLRWLLHGGATASASERSQRLQVRRLCTWLRKWRQAKKRVVGGALSAYGLTLVALYYLQRAGVLPILDCSSYVVEDAQTLQCLTEGAIEERLATLEKKFVCNDGVDRNAERVLDWRLLRRDFFRFYACEFDYERTVVTLRSESTILKADKGWERSSGGRMSIEDPVEIDRDLGTLCSKRALGRLRCAFAQACVVLCGDEHGEESTSPHTNPDQIETGLLAKWAYETEGLHGDKEDGDEHAVRS
ncbi:hypothetical protein BBJ28_00017516 [Nothophytophthora sp. Chile5]|nr:hypothetical protein BBJ28_00017516 [Nothophytophthora sp. Chile5]